MTEIEAESGYLARARAALLDMYTDVISTETPEFVSGTDEVWFNQMYRLARARRRQDLVDLPDVPLFFGRLDYEPGADPRRPPRRRRRSCLHWTATRAGRGGHAAGRRLAGPGVDAVLPGDPRATGTASGCAGGTGSPTPPS